MPALLTPEQMARRAAAELRDGDYVNLGFGLPLLVSNALPRDRDVLIHTENGMLGVGPLAPPGEEDWDLINAGKQPVTALPGAAYFHQADSFAMIRGGHLDVSILGAYQVARNGDLANWVVPGERIPRVGGAMDLAVGARRVLVLMTHLTKRGEPKLVSACTLPLTGQRCVDLVITDLAVVAVTPDGFELREVAPGWTPADVQARTAAPLRVSPTCREIARETLSGRSG
jgi:3-oxoacid CoA-transferase B subunit